MADTADRQPINTVQRWPNADGEWYSPKVVDAGGGELTVTLPIDIAAATGTPAYNVTVHYRRAR